MVSPLIGEVATKEPEGLTDRHDRKAPCCEEQINNSKQNTDRYHICRYFCIKIIFSEIISLAVDLHCRHSERK